MRAFNTPAEVRMTNEFRTSLVCPFCRARFRRTRYTRRTMRCHNPNCQGAPWYRQQRLNSDPTTTWLNLSHRDKTAAQNILDCGLMTDAQYQASAFRNPRPPARLPNYNPNTPITANQPLVFASGQAN
eukprot:TRINITY_DN5419_c0_g1_i1.p1 TRINITY_DN5419_c0_g1~~TRINITY_DN5419_c0_g1_i1.p1  ORF type:complete len:128 (+),score=4.04 TRINITY_DN5419_c0_g1_i1:100-483(+)